ncbi:minor capsid protein [Treponema sp. OMZ 787]|uniref:phage minor head protein n=1 Tax=Treponema sp. OMZ 787 TaxID=2563669 RepID=UPI0020A55DB8|nr:phage minor head protein [Treponema sp. OMZ 787]UTC62588.1 minor capsid protein [Treponema sp. OMZ 787]
MVRFKSFIKEVLKDYLKNLKEALKNEKLNPEKIKNLSFERSGNKGLIRLSENLIQGSLLLGCLHAMTQKRGEKEFADDSGSSVLIEEENLSFDEAVNFLRAKLPMKKDEWLSLEPKLRFRAFTVAKLSEADFIETVKGRLALAVEKNESILDSWKDIEEMTEDWGEKFTPRYWETVYRTNVQSAYNAGRLMQHKNNMPPAWELLFVEDKRQSDICRGLTFITGNGKALHKDHPFWKTYGFPPYHFNCRTTFRAVYDFEIGHGIEIENTPMKEIGKNFKPQKGFGGNPIEKESWWKITPEMIARADRYGITADIVAQAGEFDMQSYYPELLQNYESIHKGKKGGYVQKAANSKHNPEEIASAKRLADEGHKVYLLPRSDSASSPDMIIDDEIGEMKHIDTIKRGTIREHIRKGGDRQRARILYIQIQSQKQKERLLQIVKEEILDLPIQTILLDYKGSIIKYARNFFLK